MNEQTPLSASVSMLGGFSITIGDKTINNQNNQSKKPWILLEYLITFRNRDISSNELIELIWGDEDSTNPSGALKTLLFRSRKLLTDLDCPPQNLIIQQRGTYAWNKDLDTVVDADLFENLANMALNDCDSQEQRLACCLEALEIYKGDFLPTSSWESWVVPISTYYHSLYLKVVHMAVNLLLQNEDYSAIAEVCQKASVIEPYDEELHYYLIFSLFKDGKQRAALDHYNHVIDMLYSQFAITPSDRLKSLYKLIRDTEHGITTDLSVVQDSLAEETRQNGAFFCEYSVFKDIYQLENRSIERTGDSIYLCMLTLSDLNNILLPQPFLNKGMEALGDSVCSSLRRGDVYSRYSVSQYILLLPTATYENGEVVLKRIIQNFRKSYTRKDMNVSYSLQAIIPK